MATGKAVEPPGVDHVHVDVSELRMHCAVTGAGPPVVLLHGWPQTWFCWRRVMEPLAERFTVLAPDLRGYGLTDKPDRGYDKRTMAADVRGLDAMLGHDRVALVGHDRGARVAHRYALDYPDEVSRLAVLDIAPTRATMRTVDLTVARNYWHWLFHMQPDLPERLIGADVEGYLRYFFERWTVNRAAVEAAVEHYVRAFRAPGALRASLDDYRATVPDDLAADDASADTGARLAMPLLALWGDRGLPATLPLLDIWREYADDVDGGPVADCGHFLPEEQPEAVVARLVVMAPGGVTSEA